MNVIISHDVDHLYGQDHWFRDLSYPKLWIRETLHLLRRRITVSEWLGRCISCFKRKRHNIPELIEFDKKYGIRSTFFFGMNKGLGLSYKPEEAKEMISYVKEKEFGVGVHGICFDNMQGIETEKQRFCELMDFEPDGIRMHYVRYNEYTFEFLSRAGYSFDTTDFDKSNNGTIRNPYKVGDMWEFPLTIMDGYLPDDLKHIKQETINRIQKCIDSGLDYISILFHDCYFCDEYRVLKEWYCWLVEMLSEDPSIHFISYKEAIRELEKKHNDGY